jgi:polyhydroxyalkanoate synthase
MFDSDNVWAQAPQAPDLTEATRAVTGMMQNGQAATRAMAAAVQKGTPGFDAAQAMQAMGALSMGLWANPVKTMQANAAAWNDFAELWSGAARRAMGASVEPVIAPARADRRFKDKAWSDEIGFDVVKQSYLLTARWLEGLVADADGLDDETRNQLAFMARQYLNAVSPSNFPLTNPAVVRKTLATGGVNLLSGASNLLADMARGEGLVQRRADEDFELGVSIAATPGKVVFRNELMELIQYSPSTETVARRPILFTPPTVNKFYLFDLKPETSFFKWLVDQGHTVFVISWVNPDESHAAMDLTAYVTQGPVAALDAIEQATGERVVDMIGYCLGGTLTAITAAYLAGKGEGERVGSATLIATLTDFSDLGEWSVFLGERQIAAFDAYLAEKGYVESHELARLFSTVRANDLIWAPAVTHYLMGDQAPASDMLWWFSDGARMPAAMLGEYLGKVVRDNALPEAGAMSIDGVSIDLKAVKAPVFFVSLKEDHVSGWEATYKGMDLFGGPVSFLLGGSGHNAGVINPPSAGKHGFWTNDAKAATAEAWLGDASKQDGSWWGHWNGWLKGLSDDATVKARKPGAGKLKALEAAPGSYVRVRR